MRNTDTFLSGLDRQGCLLSLLLSNTVLEVVASEVRQEKDMKGIQNEIEVNLYSQKNMIEFLYEIL